MGMRRLGQAASGLRRVGRCEVGLAWFFVVSLSAHSSVSGQTLELTEVTRFNLNAVMSSTLTSGELNPKYIGNNPSAVAWDGSRLFVAGLNNGATGTDSQNVGVIEILNTTQTGIVISTAVDYGNRFGFLPTPSQTGYTGLAMDDGRLFAALQTGVVQPNALRGYDIATPGTANLSWSVSGRGGAGVALDPGYVVNGISQGGTGVGWGTFGDGVTGSSNRRALNDPETGATIYGFAAGTTPPAGLTWNPGGFPRDITFDPKTGDVYGRSDNQVAKAIRDGVNSTSSQSFLQTAGVSGAASAIGQNIAFMNQTPVAGDLLVFNDKDGAPDLPFTDYVRLTDTSGNLQSATWNFLGGTTPTSRAGYYDFAYDPTSATLAIVDATGLRASIFRFGAPAPDTQLRWAADGSTEGGSGIWDDVATTWRGAYGPSAWQPQANAYFGGDLSGPVTVATGGVSVGRGLSFVTDGYVLDGDTITLTAAETFTNNAFVGADVTATITAGLVAPNGAAKSGAGTLVVGGTISGGPLFVNNGTLSIAATASIVGQPPNITILAPGTLDVTQLPMGFGVVADQSLAGAGTVSGNLSLLSGSTVSPGSNLGTLTVTQSMNWASGASYNWQIVDAAGTAGADPGWDLLAVGGALNIAASSSDPFELNLWSLSDTSPDINGNAANFSSTQSYTWTIASAAGGITGFSSDAFLINTAATNGTAGFSNDLGGGSFSLVVAGNNLNLVFSPGSGPSDIVINVPSGSQTQSQAGYPTIATANSVTKTGAGTLVMDATNAYSGPTTVSAGTLQVATAGAIGSSNVTVDTGATLAVASGTTMKAPSVIVDGGTLNTATLAVNSATGITALAINAGTLAGAPATTVGPGGSFSLVQDARVTVAVGSLDVTETTGGGRIDLGAGQISVAAGGITAAALRADIIAGRNGGAWNGSTGIMSSTAAAAGGTRAVGYVVAGDGAATVSFAAPGDTNLNGQVDVFDLVSINSSGKYGAGTASVWNQGDFNYDGVTNVFDLVSINSAGAYGRGNYFPAAPSVSGSLTAVPEPTSWLGLVTVVAATAGIRSWRKRNSFGVAGFRPAPKKSL
jgi:autotransporter-associated beta strand protein